MNSEQRRRPGLGGMTEEDPASPRYIQTVRGHGYRFAGPEELA